MKKLTLIAALLMIGFAVQAEPVQAQDASYATWGGSVQAPDMEEAIAVQWIVRFNSRVKTGKLVIPAMGDKPERQYDMKEIKVHDKGTMLMYKLVAGEEGQVKFTCEMNRNDKGWFKGICTEAYGNEWKMAMDASTAEASMLMGEGEPKDADTR